MIETILAIGALLLGVFSISWLRKHLGSFCRFFIHQIPMKSVPLNIPGIRIGIIGLTTQLTLVLYLVTGIFKSSTSGWGGMFACLPVLLLYGLSISGLVLGIISIAKLVAFRKLCRESLTDSPSAMWFLLGICSCLPALLPIVYYLAA
jgi:hypothetical protein